MTTTLLSEPQTKLALRFGSKKNVVAIGSIAEASEAWCKLRDESCLGSSESPKVSKMDDSTKALLENLADKFGTTAEHLWAVMIRQAPISSVCDLFVIAACFSYVLWSIWYFRTHTRIDGKPRISAFWFLILGFLPTCMFLFGLCDMPLIISGFVNPEYWALKQILK